MSIARKIFKFVSILIIGILAIPIIPFFTSWCVVDYGKIKGYCFINLLFCSFIGFIAGIAMAAIVPIVLPFFIIKCELWKDDDFDPIYDA